MDWTHREWMVPMLALLGAAFLLGLLSLRRDRSDLSVLGHLRVLASPRQALLRRFVLFLLFAAALATAGTGALGPLGAPTLRERYAAGLDVMVLLDVSKSMKVRDVEPNRLESAKRAVGAFARRREGDRFGLVVFSGDAFLQVPLTLDRDLFLLVLEEAETEAVQRGGSDFAAALRQGLEALPREGDRGKALLLVTDGERTREAGDLEGPLAEASRRGVRVLALGVGTPQGGPIPDGFSFWGEPVYKTNARGEVVVSRLDEELLRAVAERTGGAYVRSDRAGGLGALEAALEGLWQSAVRDESAQERRELAPWFGGGTAGFLLAALLLAV